MHSHWEVTYIGSNTSIFIKKFERFLGTKVHSCEKERYILENKKYERLDFLIELNAQNWNDALIEQINTVSKITPEWIITIEANKSISGLYDPKINEKKGWESLLSGPSGLYSLLWKLNIDQQYNRFKMLEGQKDEW